MKKKSLKQQHAEYQDPHIPDDENPHYIFCLANSNMLATILKGDSFSLEYLAKREMANRGLNADGAWIGFKESAKFWGLV